MKPAGFSLPGPYLIGGTGGSGTRVFGQIALRGGMYLGSRLNQASDTGFFPKFYRKWINTYMAYAPGELPEPLEKAMQQDFAETLNHYWGAFSPNGAYRCWGFKNPRSLFLLPAFHRLFPDLKFLHVVRDGRDIAFSSNQNQLRMFGDSLLSPGERELPVPMKSVIVWSRINVLRSEYGERNLAGNYLLIRFEDLCAHPAYFCRKVLGFFELAGDSEEIAATEIAPPPSIGRWKSKGGALVEELQRKGGDGLRKFGYL